MQHAGGKCAIFSVLLRRSVLILASRGDISFSLGRGRGLSGPLVGIIAQPLTACRPKIKPVVHWFRATLHKMAAEDPAPARVDVCLVAPSLSPPLCLLRAPRVYFEVVLSQLLYLWWQSLQAPQHTSFFSLWPLVLVRPLAWFLNILFFHENLFLEMPKTLVPLLERPPKPPVY